MVTGNKALLAQSGGELAQLANVHGVDLLYEAAVAAAIPVIRPLRESLAGERIIRVMGIVNGTTNFILTKMDEDGSDYSDALVEAQRLGLAERDPTADVEGLDAAAKAAILAGLAFGADVVADDVSCEGITGVRAVDVAYADRLGYAVKLLAVAELVDGGPDISVRVHPAMVPRGHPLGFCSRCALTPCLSKVKRPASSCFMGEGRAERPARARYWATWLMPPDTYRQDRLRLHHDVVRSRFDRRPSCDRPST